MQNTDYPLIFIVDDNFIYNKLIVNHLRSHSFNKVESFLSGEDCLKNLYKKPDIVIQDYLMNGISGIDVLKESKKTLPNTEFIFLSGFNNTDIAVNTIKYGAYDYVVKDSSAMKKLSDSINKITNFQKGKLQQKLFKKSVALFFIALSIIVISIVGWALIHSNSFPG